MFGIELTAYDREIYERELADFLPDRMIDVHAHIWETGLRADADRRGAVTWTDRVAADCGVRDLLQTYAQLFPGKAVTPVLMGWPLAGLDRTNAYAAAAARAHGLRALYCTAWDTPAETVRAALTMGGFAGLKPYLSHSPPYIPPDEMRIFDFLPHAHLRVADELSAPVILHIARPGRLRDPVNIAQLMEIEQNYPNVRLIVAHVGRAYIEADIGGAFDILRRTERMLFDFSANTLDAAMAACLEAVGPKRVLFGSDMPITKMRMYRIEEDGMYKNVVPRGLYGDVSGDKNMKETDETDVTVFLYEELLAFKRCAKALGLSKADVGDIFCHNAARVFGKGETP